MIAATPAPWRFLEADDHAEPHNACRPLTIAGPDNDDLAQVYSSDDATVSIPREQAVANARIMAAAPRMAAAIRDFLYALDRGFLDCKDDSAFIDDLRAALAQATSARIAA